MYDEIYKAILKDLTNHHIGGNIEKYHGTDWVVVYVIDNKEATDLINAYMNENYPDYQWQFSQDEDQNLMFNIISGGAKEEPQEEPKKEEEPKEDKSDDKPDDK